MFLANFISIHAPPRGATGRYAQVDGHRGYFNSRPSARGDGKIMRWGSGGQISIHAPPRGATYENRKQVAENLFQFTPLREGRPRVDGRGSAGRHHFNSRPSARGDAMARSDVPSQLLHFNSRPSARGDMAINSKARHDLFQFTPLREGRP